MFKNLPMLGLILVLTVAFVRGSFFIVTEGEQAIVLEFGNPKGEALKSAGLYFKPFWREARFIEKRILNWDASSAEIPTNDKKFITVDTTARWQISDPLKFIQTVQNETGALSRLTSIVGSSTQDTISNFNLVDAVRNSNEILVRNKELRQANEKARSKAGNENIDEEIVGEIEAVAVGREQLSIKIVEKARPELKEKFGIDLIDVQIRRIAYNPKVEEKVYDRMISERLRIASKIRSVGKGEQARIQGKTSEEAQTIESEAFRSIQQILGAAESERAAIYATAFNQDTDFYKFYRTLEAYDKSIKEDTSFLFSTESEFLSMLKEQK